MDEILKETETSYMCVFLSTHQSHNLRLYQRFYRRNVRAELSVLSVYQVVATVLR